MAKYKLVSLFAGIGGIDLGFEMAGFKSVWANEIDKFCSETFVANHKHTKLVVGDIKDIKATDLPDFDVLGGGFPCQPFSVAGHQKGFEDDRGGLFFQIIRLIEELDSLGKKPRVVFLENVKNLKNHDDGKTYNSIKQKLNDNGYYVDERILNTAKYGDIPQNRERLFIVGFLRKEDFDNFAWPKEIKLKKSIEDIINWMGNGIDEKYFYKPNLKCWKYLESGMQRKHTIYQFRRVYVRENKSKLCPTLTANMGMGGHNVPLICDDLGRIRKLTPRECLLFQGFPETFIIPESLSDSSVYKQAGNSVSVTVVERIAANIKKAMDKSKSYDYL